jgi:hypothetical protein
VGTDREYVLPNPDTGGEVSDAVLVPRVVEEIDLFVGNGVQVENLVLVTDAQVELPLIGNDGPPR